MKNLVKINEPLWVVFSFIVNHVGCRSLNIIFLAIFTPALLLGQMVVGTITNPGFVPSSMAVYEAGNKLFVSDTESKHLLIYDCTSLNLIGELDLGYPGMMVVHESTGKLYLNIHIDWGGKIAVINTNTNELIRFIDGVNGTLRIDESLGKVYVLERLYNDINLQVIDIATDTVSTVQLSGGYIYSSIKVNPVTHDVFIGYRSVGDEKLDIVDGTTMTRTTVAAPNCRDLAVNWIENKVYLIPGPLNRYWVYDRDTGSAKDITSCYNDACLIYFNPADNKIYTDSEVDNSTIIIDGVTDSCVEIPMYGATERLAFRHASNHVYYVGLYGIVVMDGNTQLVEQFPNFWLDPDDCNIVINQSTGRVFVNYYQSDPQASNTIVVLQDTEMMICPPVFVGDRGTNESYVLDPITKETVEIWYPTYAVHGMAVRPGGGRIYEATYNTFSMNGSLREYAGCASVDLTPFNSYSTGGNYPTFPVVNPDGSQIYVTNSGSDDVSVINTETNTVTSIIPVGESPWGAASMPDGSKVYVANKDNNTASVISTASNTVINTIAVGTKPWGVVVNPSGTKAYVANSGSGTISVIDIFSDNVIATIPVGSAPHWLACTPDGKHVYVTNSRNATVSIIDAGNDMVIQTIPVEPNPEGIAAFPDGSEVYVATDSTVNVINTSDYSVSIILIPDIIEFWLSHKLVPLVIADPTSRFAGRVTSGSVPVNNALIRAVQEGVEKGNASSNAVGDYSVFNLKPGTYDIDVSTPGFYSQTLSAQNVGAGQTTVLHFDLISTGVALSDKMPSEFSLNQNYPNPFNATTIIKYSIPKSCNITFKIYNLEGQEIYTLADVYHAVGVHEINWTTEGLPSGIYFYRLQAGDFSETKKLVLQK